MKDTTIKGHFSGQPYKASLLVDIYCLDSNYL